MMVIKYDFILMWDIKMNERLHYKMSVEKDTGRSARNSLIFFSIPRDRKVPTIHIRRRQYWICLRLIGNNVVNINIFD